MLLLLIAPNLAQAGDLRVGAATVKLKGDDSMVISGGIGPRYAKGREGELRVTAVVLEKPKQAKLAIVACDALFVSRRDVDPCLEEIEKTIGIPLAHVLVNATHTHHAPSTTRVHGYDREEVFCKRLREGIVRAVRQANARLNDGDASRSSPEPPDRVLPERIIHLIRLSSFWGPPHSYAEVGSGERVAEEAVKVLHELKQQE